VWHLSAYQPADVTTVSEAQSVQKLLSTDFQILSILALFLVFVYFFVLLFFILQGTEFYRSLTKKGRMKAARTSKSTTIQAKRPSVHKFQLKNLKAFVDEVHQFPTHDLVKIHDTDDIEHDHSVDYRFLDNYKKVVAAGDIVHTVHDKREAKVVRVYMRSTDETPFADIIYIIEVARKIEVISKKPHLEDGDFSMANPLVLKNTMLAAKLEHDKIVEQMKMELESHKRQVETLQKELERVEEEDTTHVAPRLRGFNSDDDDDEHDEVSENRQPDENDTEEEEEEVEQQRPRSRRVRGINDDDDEEEEDEDDQSPRSRSQRESFQPRAWSGWALTGGLF
jgi:hypothetical protein